MAQHDQQPEEAISRPAAAAAQFAGNFTQTSMYGRALNNRGTPGPQQPIERATGRPIDAPTPNTPGGTGESRPVAEPTIVSTLSLTDDPALRLLTGRLDPVEEAMRPAELPPGQ